MGEPGPPSEMEERPPGCGGLVLLPDASKSSMVELRVGVWEHKLCRFYCLWRRLWRRQRYRRVATNTQIRAKTARNGKRARLVAAPREYDWLSSLAKQQVGAEGMNE